MDPVRARARLLDARFSEPGISLLWLVQAAVRSGCREIDFHEHSPGLEMLCRFDTDSVFPKESLSEGLRRNPWELEDGPVRDMVTGIAMALTDGPVGVSFRGPNGWKLLQHPALRMRSRGRGYVFLLDYVDMRDFIRERCRYAPVRILWDNRLLARGRRKRRPRILERIGAGSGLGLSMADTPRVRRSREGARLLPTTQLYCRQMEREGSFQVEDFRSAGSWRRCGLVVSLPLDFKGPSRLLLVRRGITLDPIELHTNFGATVVMETFLDVDLSGLRVREEGLEDTIQLALSHLRSAAQAALRELPAMGRAQARRREESHLLQLGAAFLLCAVLPLREIAGILVCLAPLPHLLKRSGREEAMLFKLRERLEQLVETLEPSPTCNLT